ncbi:MAG: CPBP family intramembrane metalloprotease [Treponema sp.]|jgi:membrane protease YdiL (CAAX protease family)|nr:CPBP family intramembrane metalloprotease [Treponema sp.]
MSEGTNEGIIENKPYPSIKNAIFLCLLLLGFQLVVGIIPWITTYIFEIDTESLLYEIVKIFISLLPSGLVIYIGYKKSHKRFDEIFVFNDVSSNLWIATTVFMCGFVILSSELSNILNYFLPLPRYLQEVFDTMLDNKYIIISVVSVGIIPAFIEEMLFRGVILNGFKENYSHKKAIIVSSLLFGIVHLNPWQFVTAFIMGMVSAWVCLKLKSLTLSIYMHMFNNTAAVFVVKTRDVVLIKGFNTGPSEQTFQPLWFDVLGIVLVSIGIILFLGEIEEN